VIDCSRLNLSSALFSRLLLLASGQQPRANAHLPLTGSNGGNGGNGGNGESSDATLLTVAANGSIHATESVDSAGGIWTDSRRWLSYNIAPTNWNGPTPYGASLPQVGGITVQSLILVYTSDLSLPLPARGIQPPGTLALHSS
jgi:hypothetical protein